MTYTLAEIAQHINAKLVAVNDNGNAKNCTIKSLATLANASNEQVAFLANKKYVSQLSATQASAVIISPDMLSQCPVNALVMDNPYMGYAMLANLLDSTPEVAEGIHISAVIADDVTLGENVSIGANTVIESGVKLDDEVSIGAGGFIGKNTSIGKGTRLWSNCSVYHNVVIGEACLIQANTVIGSDGFGYAPVNEQYKWHKIPQLGRVVIGNHVEIGASTTIDRGALDDTCLADGVIIDNQCQIAHNVVIGENTAIAGCTVVGGSTRIGRNCTIGGLSAITGHVEIADNVHFTGMSMVTKGVSQAGAYSSGLPSQPSREWRKAVANVRSLERLSQRVRKLEKHYSEHDSADKGDR